MSLLQKPEQLTGYVLVSFSGQECSGMQSLCAGYRGAAPCWGQGATPIGRLRAAAIIGSRVKRLAQGELMPASTRTGYYLTHKSAGLAASPLLPLREKSAKIGEMKIEIDTAQRTLRQAWHL